MDIFIPRGAWLLIRSGRRCCETTATGGFTDVTREAGLLDPVNSNAAAWADYDNDGWVDLFIGCERQTNRLYRNRGNGTFEEVAAKAGVQADADELLQGLHLGRPRQRRLSRPVPQQSARGRGRLYPQQSRRHVHGRQLSPGHRRAPQRILVLGMGLRQRRLAGYLRHLLRPHAG